MIAALSVAALAVAAPPGYALVIGNNAVPEGATGLERLRYADDDALRFHALFSRASMQATLLTVADPASQRRYPAAVEASVPPTRANLERAVAELEAQLTEDRAAGRPTTAYLFFSGHGGVNARGEPYLALLDGQLTRARLFTDVLDRLPADRVHVIIDACNAGAVVGLRGPFDGAGEAPRAPLAEAELAALADADRLERYPHVGFMVAAASGRAAHEWSRLESGVFSHEVYSALLGGGDVNGDGQLEYSEVEAFVSAANSRLEDARSRLSIRTRPPAAYGRAPVFDLGWLGAGPFLVGHARAPVRVSVERSDGQRILDVHLASGMRFKLALPVSAVAYVRTREREARLGPRPSGEIDFARLEFDAREVAERGAFDDALRRGLFAAPYGTAYYLGYADSRGLVAVDMGAAPALGAARREPASADPLVTVLWVGSAVAAGAALVAGGVALERRSAFGDAPTQRDAADIARTHDRSRNVAVGTAAAAGVLAALALTLGLTSDDGAVVATASPEDGGWQARIGWTGRF